MSPPRASWLARLLVSEVRALAKPPGTGTHTPAGAPVRVGDFERSDHATSPPTIQAVAAGAFAATVVIMPIDLAHEAAQDDPTEGRPRNPGRPITGRLADGSLFTGAISNLRASVVDGELTLTGTLTRTDPPVGSQQFTQQFTQTLSLSQLYVNYACSVLILDLGPLHLDQIGSTVKVIPIELSVEPGTESGSANLLPAMFGWLAGLLDNDGPVEGISTLLNRIFPRLGLRH